MIAEMDKKKPLGWINHKPSNVNKLNSKLNKKGVKSRKRFAKVIYKQQLNDTSWDALEEA